RGEISSRREAPLPHIGHCCLTRGCERMKAGDRGSVVDDALKCAGKTEETAQPRQRDLLELGSRGRGAPQHSLLIERCRQKLREDAGRARRGGEVREEPGMVPVRQRWNENAFEVRKDLVEAFAGFGAVLRQRATHLTWHDARQNGVPLRST